MCSWCTAQMVFPSTAQHPSSSVGRDGYNAHSYPLLWRIAFSPVSTSLGNPKPMTGWHRIQRTVPLPQGWTTCVVWFPLQSIHPIRLKLSSTWDYVLAQCPASTTTTMSCFHYTPSLKNTLSKYHSLRKPASQSQLRLFFQGIRDWSMWKVEQFFIVL